ncbi:MAG TPA: type IV toxin-antitoxin system AbiEi family antitoxin domain-containing protein [Candidatus Elarobacter sp.]|jgi:predicted transcriptional regulator of viral defense system|nr:type IV toxin-antitoxin system AbiEi family antitoxin domain-containing protein [Candidatus Elarobacter sp.]
MPRTYPNRLDTLIAVSEGQDGYFTTEQARDAGLTLHALAGLEQAGHLDREQYGIYRLARWPSSKRPGLWRAILWSTRIDPRATFSHRTALQLHDVSDINPSKIDVTLPLDVRVRSTKPPAVVTHRRHLTEGDVEEIDSLRVTTLYRTLLDLATDNLAHDAVAGVLNRGTSLDLSKEQLQQVRAIYALSDDTRQHLARAFSVDRDARVRVNGQ